ncbi:MAG: tRNA pseudouridine(13) synthase TruD [Candidatus Micrarchaeia archaeon]
MRFLSKTAGLGGSYGDSPGTFFVSEILPDGTPLPFEGKFSPARNAQDSGGFCRFAMRKSGWTTTAALSEIARKMHASSKRFNAAGNKDKNATTVQLASCLGAKPAELLSLNLRGIEILGAWESNSRVRIGELLGNRFRIKHLGRVPGSAAKAGKGRAKPMPKAQEKRTVSKIRKETGGFFLNYFGRQRFGSLRQNTHEIGVHLLRGDFKAACEAYLFSSPGAEPESYRIARRELEGSLDFKKALGYFPRHLSGERQILSHLAVRPSDYAGALRAMPRSTLLLFVHAVQSHVFNMTLDLRHDAADFRPSLVSGEHYCMEKGGFFIPGLLSPVPDKKSGGKNIALRLVGHEAKSLNPYESEAMDSLSIKPEDFKVPGMPELSARGGFRSAYAKCVDFSFDGEWFEFSLQSGSYATVALEEYLKEKKI